MAKSAAPTTNSSREIWPKVATVEMVLEHRLFFPSFKNFDVWSLRQEKSRARPPRRSLPQGYSL